MVMNDRALPGILQAIADHNLKIPQDLSVVALVSSVRMAEMMIPKLTTMEPPGVELGKLATELLINNLEGKSDGSPRIVIPCHLVMGESSGPCNSNTGYQNQQGGKLP